LTVDAGLHEFVRDYRPRLSQVAYLLTGDHHAAQDLVQATLMKVVTSWSRVVAADRPEAYVRRMLYHEHVSWWRRRARITEQLAAELPDHPAQPEDPENVVVRKVVLQRAMRRLTPRQQALLVLRFYEDLSESEVAVALNCSVGTVKKQVYRALRRLRVLAPELTVEFSADLVTVKVFP
jgi:RNA polymerase sigma-70 factor (sigma-E family)